MQHGLIDIGGTWFFNEPTKSPAVQMAKKGYDIWIENNRGTANSYKHLTLTDKDKAYWEFTVNEMGKYDVPTIVDFILN